MSKPVIKFILFSLFLLLSLTWLFALSTRDPDKLKIIACNVGQGDAFLLIRGSSQILIDGGPDSSVINCLSRYLPFWDRTIEVVILSHPEKDHYMGLIEVFKRYRVLSFFSSAQTSSDEYYFYLQNEIASNNTKAVHIRSGTTLRLDNIYLKVISPSPQSLKLASPTTDPNELSLVIHLSFGSFDALFTGDIGPEVADSLINKSLIKDIEYLKVPHHGSKNGLTPELLKVADPEIAVVSVGKNSFGHPHKEVLNMLHSADVKILRTDRMGDIKLITDREKYWLQSNVF